MKRFVNRERDASWFRVTEAIHSNKSTTKLAFILREMRGNSNRPMGFFRRMQFEKGLSVKSNKQKFLLLIVRSFRGFEHSSKMSGNYLSSRFRRAELVHTAFPGFHHQRKANVSLVLDSPAALTKMAA